MAARNHGINREGSGAPVWEDQIVSAIRKVIKAVDSHSRHLRERYGLTTPQFLVLRQLAQNPSMSAGELARAVQLGQPTVKVILDRLESRELVERRRDEKDRRSTRVRLTETGQAVLKQAPPLLHMEFRQRLSKLEDWERTLVVSVMQRVGSMMSATEIEAAPVLAVEPIPAPITE